MDRKEAIEIIIKNYPHVSNSGSQFESALRELIPELAESDDERIRKRIIDIVDEYSATNQVDNSDCIDWLEKQKGQSIIANDLDEEVHRFFDDCIVVYEAKLYGNISERVIPVDCYELTARHFAKWGEQQKEQKPFSQEDFDIAKHEALWGEQKPAENISQLTVQGKGVYKICPHCKERMVRDDSKVYTSMPPQYGYECPKCGAIVFDTVMYDSPEKQKPTEVTYIEDSAKCGAGVTVTGDSYSKDSMKPAEWSEEDEENFKWFDKFFRAESIVAGGRDIPQDKYLWFKSLRPQPHWKPSEEQLGTLLEAKGVLSESSHFVLADKVFGIFKELKKLI